MSKTSQLLEQAKALAGVRNRCYNENCQIIDRKKTQRHPCDASSFPITFLTQWTQTNRIEGDSITPGLVYLTAQTMFRSIPDTKSLHNVSPEIYELGLLLRRRLFYLGLYAGHLESALCLWRSFSYETAAGKSEKEMILRCLKLPPKEKPSSARLILLTAVRIDADDDVVRASKEFDFFLVRDFAEYDLLWRRRAEILHSVSEERAFNWIWAGREYFAAPVIVAALKQLLDFTKDERMKLRIYQYLSCFSTEYSFNFLATQYEKLGDKLMAREYHELAGATGNKESRAWLVEYLEDELKNAWFKNPETVKHLESWKKML